jgi:hypothetical protein
VHYKSEKIYIGIWNVYLSQINSTFFFFFFFYQIELKGILSTSCVIFSYLSLSCGIGFLSVVFSSKKCSEQANTCLVRDFLFKAFAHCNRIDSFVCLLEYTGLSTAYLKTMCTANKRSRAASAIALVKDNTRASIIYSMSLVSNSCLLFSDNNSI